MNRLIMVGVLALSGLAQAAVECGSVRAFLAPGLPMVVQYREAPVFPNPPRTQSMPTWLNGQTFPAFSFDQCGVQASFDGTVYRVQANSLPELRERTGMDLATTLWKLPGQPFLVAAYQRQGYEYPAIRQGFYIYRTTVVYDPQLQQVSILSTFPAATTPEQVVGIQLDDGPVQPLWFDSRATPVQIGAASTFTITIRPTPEAQLEQVVFDLTQPSLSLRRSPPKP